MKAGTKRAPNTKERIIQESINLFYEFGFTKASTRQLVGRVGMTSSAIYNHFANKDEILFTIIQRGGERILNLLKDAVEKYEDPCECLKQMVSRILYLFGVSAMKKELAIFTEELHQLPKPLRKICEKQHRQIFDLYRNQICDLQKKGLMNPINPTVATFGIIGAMLWVSRWFRDDGQLSMEEIAEELVGLLLNGLKKVDYAKVPSEMGRALFAERV
jgi:TetR/AcrR family transcriptional regulator, cholesterol catabolism regulator